MYFFLTFLYKILQVQCCSQTAQRHPQNVEDRCWSFHSCIWKWRGETKKPFYSMQLLNLSLCWRQQRHAELFPYGSLHPVEGKFIMEDSTTSIEAHSSGCPCCMDIGPTKLEKSFALTELLKLQAVTKTVELTSWSCEREKLRSFLTCLPYISHLWWVEMCDVSVGDVEGSSKNENSVIIYSPVWHYLFSSTQIKLFWRMLMTKPF